MIILDWRDPISLGNIVGTSYASEYIRNSLHQDIGIIPADYHQDVYKLSVPSDRIYSIDDIPPDSEIRTPHLNNYNHIHNIDETTPLPWMHNLVASAGYWMSREYKVDPYICWLHSPKSRKVLIYPREHHNKNIYFNMDYWIAACHEFLKNNWQIVAILHVDFSHRDIDISVNWCNEFRNKVNCSQIFSPTIQGLQAACAMCDLSFGIFSGPFWLMLKSTIRQVVISDPNDTYKFHHATYNLPFIKKQVIHIPNNSLEIIGTL